MDHYSNDYRQAWTEEVARLIMREIDSALTTKDDCFSHWGHDSTPKNAALGMLLALMEATGGKMDWLEDDSIPF